MKYKDRSLIKEGMRRTHGGVSTQSFESNLDKLIDENKDIPLKKNPAVKLVKQTKENNRK